VTNVNAEMANERTHTI